jgi:hypothetical protein
MGANADANGSLMDLLVHAAYDTERTINRDQTAA